MAIDDDHNSAKAIADAVNEISERASLLVREEIELAKAEISQKLGFLARGAGVGAAAGVFAIFGVILLFEGLAWLAYWVLPFPTGTFFWGFFVISAILFAFAGLAAMMASRLFKRGSAPTPQMAIEEAKKTKEELSSS